MATSEPHRISTTTEDATGVLRLGESAKHPYLVGHALGATDADEGIALSLLGRVVGREPRVSAFHREAIRRDGGW